MTAGSRFDPPVLEDALHIWFVIPDVGQPHVLLVHMAGRDDQPPMLRPLMTSDRTIAEGWSTLAAMASADLGARCELRTYQLVEIHHPGTNGTAP